MNNQDNLLIKQAEILLPAGKFLRGGLLMLAQAALEDKPDRAAQKSLVNYGFFMVTSSIPKSGVKL